eukprot:9469382-Karenia_brevis.AAC.1
MPFPTAPRLSPRDAFVAALIDFGEVFCLGHDEKTVYKSWRCSANNDPYFYLGMQALKVAVDLHVEKPRMRKRLPEGSSAHNK